MGLFTKKKKQSVPDLSRYNYQASNNAGSSQLSSGAASAALRTYSLTSNSYQPSFGGDRSRRGSITRNTTNDTFRANSLQAYNSNYNSANYNSANYQRANSLSYNQQRYSPSVNNSRSNSLSLSNGGRASYLSNGFHGNNNNSNNNNDNPIIIHTIRTEDEFGRTKSITTETIQKFGSYELVKTETQDLIPSSSNQFGHRSGIRNGGGSYAGSLFSNNELNSIAEDNEFQNFNGQFHEDQTYMYPKKENKRMTMILEPDNEEDLTIPDSSLNTPIASPTKRNTQRSPGRSNLARSSYAGAKDELSDLFQEPSKEGTTNKSILKPITASSIIYNKVDGSLRNSIDNTNSKYDDDDVSDGGSVYSDAFDKMPYERKNKKRVQLVNNSSRRSSITRNSINNHPSNLKSSKPVKQLTDEEMYAKALEIAQRKVYGEANSSNDIKPNLFGGFKSHSLRDTELHHQQPTTKEIEPQQQKENQKGKKKFSFKRLFKQK